MTTVLFGVICAVIGVTMILGAASSKHESAPIGCGCGLCIVAFGALLVTTWHESTTAKGRHLNARATIAAATATAIAATAESELRALERAAATAAAAVRGASDG